MGKTTLDKMKIGRSGRISIVSSGYTDRYPLSTVWLTIRHNGVTYRIENEHERVSAILTLAGLEATEVNVQAALSAIRSGDFDLWATYENGNTTGSIKTTTDRLRAGIAVATEFPGLNEHGAYNAKTLANTLTAEEWMAIRTGLEKINEVHQKKGKPVVTFHIPEAGRAAAQNRNSDD